MLAESGDLSSEHAEVAQRKASAVARERLGSDDDARHEHHDDDDVEAAAGECIPGSTSLVDGEACTVRVLFSPSRREVLTGSLTISTPLAGAPSCRWRAAVSCGTPSRDRWSSAGREGQQHSKRATRRLRFDPRTHARSQTREPELCDGTLDLQNSPCAPCAAPPIAFSTAECISV